MAETNPNLQLASAPPPPKADAKTVKKLEDLLARFEIHIAEAQDLTILEDYEVVIIADDSGSMRAPAAPPQFRKFGGANATRWDELKATISEMVDIATCFDQSGVDIYFLNRPPLLGVKSAQDAKFVSAFNNGPGGSTPLTETLGQVAGRAAGERPLLLFILTDGEPNGGPGPFANAVRRLVAKDATPKVRIQVMACTPNDDEIEWLNKLDASLKELDVTDDYYTEMLQVQNAGLAPKFSRGDWCLKAMLGPVSHKFDQWDERLGKRGKGGSPQCDICSIQ